MTISIGAEIFVKNQNPFMVKTLTKIGKKGNFLSTIKVIYGNTQLKPFSMTTD